MFTADQTAVASALIEKIDMALAWVLEAGDTSAMSDAKQIVYELLSDVSDDAILPEAVRARLKEMLDQARTFIVSGTSPASRALHCYARLADVQKCLLHLVYEEQRQNTPEQRVLWPLRS